jgi:hypothetical protein
VDWASHALSDCAHTIVGGHPSWTISTPLDWVHKQAVYHNPSQLLQQRHPGVLNANCCRMLLTVCVPPCLSVTGALWRQLMSGLIKLRLGERSLLLLLQLLLLLLLLLE